MIAQYQAILELDPTQYEYVRRLGEVHQTKGDFPAATSYFARYAEQFPDDHEAYLALGRLNRLQGEFAEARAQFERALLIKPNDVPVELELALLERRTGNLAAELEALQALLARSVTAQDSVRVLSTLQAAYRYRGQVNRSIDYMHQGWAVAASFNPPVAMLIQQLTAVDEYVIAGQEARARETIAAIRAQVGPPFDGLIPLGELQLALELENADQAEATIADLQRFIDAFGAAALNDPVLQGRARVAELRGQYADAIKHFETQLANDPTDMSIHTDIGRCYRKMGDLDAAERALNRSLRSLPNNPTAHYELALVAEARGDRAKAADHLRRALEVWAEADATFRPAREARERLAALSAR
jgi:Flp pilus assembly protein TadD